jgi:hypothetical protein
VVDVVLRRHCVVLQHLLLLRELLHLLRAC